MNASERQPRTRIKICGFTRPEDIDAAVSMGVDAVGFVLFAQSPRFVTVKKAAQLARRLPPFVTPVLLFVNAEVQFVRTACDAIPGATVQFHGDESQSFCAEATDNCRIPFIRAARIPSRTTQREFDLKEFASTFSSAQGILVDSESEGFGGSGRKFEWSRIPLDLDFHLILGGGLNVDNVKSGIQMMLPRCRSLAVDVSSGVESSRGIKDHDRMRQFIAAVADAQTLSTA